MADSNHQGNDGDPSEAGEAPAAVVEESRVPAEAHGEHAHPPAAVVEKTGAAHGAHGHKPNVREYMVIFVALAALTALEVGVAKLPGISRTLIGIALVGLALTKASIVALYYMHLKNETRVLKMTVAIPMAAPTIYALVLISEAAWRLTRW